MLGQIELTNLHKINMKREKSYTESPVSLQMKPDVYAQSSYSKNAGIKPLNNMSFGSGEQDGIRKLSNRLIMLTKQEIIDDEALAEIKKILNRPSTSGQDISYRTKQEALYNALEKGHLNVVELIFEKLEPKYCYNKNEKSKDKIEIDILTTKLIALSKQERLECDLTEFRGNVLDTDRFRYIPRDAKKEAINNALEKGNFLVAELIFNRMKKWDNKYPLIEESRELLESSKTYKQNYKQKLLAEDREIGKRIITEELQWIVENMADINLPDIQRPKQECILMRKPYMYGMISEIIDDKEKRLLFNELTKEDIEAIKDKRTGFTLLMVAMNLHNKSLEKALIDKGIKVDETEYKRIVDTYYAKRSQIISDRIEKRLKSNKANKYS